MVDIDEWGSKEGWGKGEGWGQMEGEGGVLRPWALVVHGWGLLLAACASR